MVYYEWDIEIVKDGDTEDKEDGEILDHNHCESFKQLIYDLENIVPEEGTRFEVVLVRDDDEGRSWAYVINGKLTQYFYDADTCIVANTPQRFHKEVEKFVDNAYLQMYTSLT